MHGWWMAELWHQNPMLLFSWVFWVILSISLHELGHGYAAIKCGDDTPRLSGHMTLNPIVHMGVPSLIMFAIVGIAWGMMPVNPSRLRRTIDTAIVAAAGPAVNVLLAILCIVLAIFWITYGKSMADPSAYENTRILLTTGAGLNIVLTVFNLIPVPPLDGSKIVATFIRPYREFLASHSGSLVGMVMMLVLFQFVGGFIFELGFGAAMLVIDVGALILNGGHSPR